MAEHSTLTGASLHESKGAASAAQYTAQIANGSGSATWQKITSNSIDTGSIKNVNKYLTTHLLQVGTSPTYFLVPVPTAATLTKCTAIVHAAMTSANDTITFTNSTGPTVIGTLTMTQAGSAEGSRFTFTPVSNNGFTSGAYLKVAADGTSGGNVETTFLCEWTYT